MSFPLVGSRPQPVHVGQPSSRSGGIHHGHSTSTAVAARSVAVFPVLAPERPVFHSIRAHVMPVKPTYTPCCSGKALVVAAFIASLALFVFGLATLNPVAAVIGGACALLAGRSNGFILSI